MLTCILITSLCQRKLCHTDIHFDEMVVATSYHTYHLPVSLCSPLSNIPFDDTNGRTRVKQVHNSTFKVLSDIPPIQLMSSSVLQTFVYVSFISYWDVFGRCRVVVCLCSPLRTNCLCEKSYPQYLSFSSYMHLNCF